jgi:hypothetical protein
MLDMFLFLKKQNYSLKVKIMSGLLSNYQKLFELVSFGLCGAAFVLSWLGGPLHIREQVHLRKGQSMKKIL